MHALLSQMLNNCAQTAVFTNKLQCRFRADSFNWLEIVTSKKDAKVNKLQGLTRLDEVRKRSGGLSVPVT